MQCAESGIPVDRLAGPAPAIDGISLDFVVTTSTLPSFDRPLATVVREVPLVAGAPWIRSLGKLSLEVTTKGWCFPTPIDALRPAQEPTETEIAPATPEPATGSTARRPARIRVRPPMDAIFFKDRLLYLLQPPL